MRRDLAELSRMPDGYEYTYTDVQGNVRTLIVLSPPDIMAIQRSDGVWSRQYREPSRNNPAPYDEAWYAQYLAINGLPSWFLRREHCFMIMDDFEARVLGLENAPTTTMTPQSNYLEQRYPDPVAYPVPRRNEGYVLSDLDERAAHLSRAFPAINIDGVESAVVVLPSGHIQLRSEGVVGMPTVSELDVEWIESEKVIQASYIVDPNRHPLNDGRRDMYNEAQPVLDAGGLVNPVSIILGVGDWGWLNPAVDMPRALEMGYTSPQEVTEARRQGALPIGIGPNAGPFVTFRPDRELLNPERQPDGEGAWRFLTNGSNDSDAGWAALNLGGNHNLPTRPTAAQVFRLRQWLIMQDRVDITQDINIVWVPGAPQEDDTWSPPGQEDTPRAATTAAPYQPGRSPAPSPALVHDPTNGERGGEHDQTGGRKATYDTVELKGQRITVDRSRCHVGDVEPHKMWCYGSRGWKRWQHAGTMNWRDAKKIAALNKHREQTYQRAGFWPALRQQQREDYSLEQREWLRRFVVEAAGQRPKLGFPELTRQFNERFNVTRGETGIISLFDRLRKEYHDPPATQARKPRGWKQHEDSLRARGQDAGSKRKRSREEDVEEDDDDDEDDEDDE